nr:DoxX family protein [Streptomyces sp. TS71-3]
METRTPRTRARDSSSGFDDAPALTMVKVHSDPAQIVVDHASFRVHFPTAQPARSPRVARYLSATAAHSATLGAPGHSPGLAGPAGHPPALSGAIVRRRGPLARGGAPAPGDPVASGLLQTVATGLRPGGGPAGHDPGATQVIPRIDIDADTAATPMPRGSDGTGTRLLPQMRPASGPYTGRPGPGRPGAPGTGRGDRDVHEGGDHGGYDDGHGRGRAPYETGEYAEYADDAEYGEYGEYDEYGDYADDAHGADGYDEADGYGEDRRGADRARRRGTEPVRHAYYPGRRMNLGVVLLPLRVFLGFISLYAGMSKLCDPAYFDAGERGSLVKGLHALHPWALAEPLRDFALQHPVGAGLTVAFLQVIVGVLTMLGLWQRVVAAVGALLSAALLVTVSWHSAPGYGAPDIIYLAAWSPLIIAGAPVYSVDGRLSSEAWRTLGPRAELWELRRRVLRRGTLIAGLVTGLTFLVGALLGGAVRDTDRVTVPGPGEAPRNELPGSPLPQEPGAQESSSPAASGSPTRGSSAGPSKSATAGSAGATASAGTGRPSTSQATGGAPTPHHPAPPAPPAATSGPSSTGGSASAGTTTSGTSGTGSGDNADSGGLVGGLLG